MSARRIRPAIVGCCCMLGLGAAMAEIPPGIPDTIYLKGLNGKPEDRMMASLQGIVARESPEIYIAGGSIWLNELLTMYPEIDTEVHDALWFLEQYRDHLSGYILYETDLEANVATSLAGVLDAVMVHTSIELLATWSDLPLVVDVRGRDNAWVWANYGHLFNRNYLIHHDPAQGHRLRDFAVYKRSFVFYEDAEFETYYAAQNPHTWQFGWGIEYDYFLRGTRHALMSPAMTLHEDASVLSQWKLPIESQKTHTPPNVPTDPDGHYVAFVMSDGDNFSWLSQGMHTQDKWYRSPHRGTFTMNWDLSSSYMDVNPIAFNWYMDTASQSEYKDHFVSANGPATIYPSEHPDIEGFAPVNGYWMARADQTVMSILEATESSFDLAAYQTILDDPRVMGVMLKAGRAYIHNDGQIYWHDGKPVLGVKYSMWDGHYTPDDLANTLNTNPRDPLNNQDSYSLVNVHPWSYGFEGDPMSNIRYVVDRLDPDVHVVTLEELIIHLRNNFGRPVYTDCNDNGLRDLDEARMHLDEYFRDPGTTDWTLGGDALLPGDVLQLTQDVPGSAGSILRAMPSDEPVAAVDVEFDFRISPGGGDGFVSFDLLDAGLVALPESATRGPGDASLSVEFDTHANAGEVDNHVEVWLGSTSLGQSALGFSLDDGEWHTARIGLIDGELTVEVQARRGVWVLAFDKLSLPGFVPYLAYFGFDAETAGGAIHEIDNLTIIHHLAADANGDGVLDACETPGDVNHDGVFDAYDIDWMHACLQGPHNDPSCRGTQAAVADNDDDGDVDLSDWARFQADWAGVIDPPPPPQNIIPNPDFEEGQSGGSYPNDWFHSATGAIWTQDDWISPTRAIKQVDDSASTNTGWRSKAQQLPVGTTAIEIEWYWRYEDLSESWQRVVAFGTGADQIGNLQGFYAQDLQQPAEATSIGWEHHVLQLPVPEHPDGPSNPVYVDLRFRSWGDANAVGAMGTMWVDDVRVSPIP